VLSFLKNSFVSSTCAQLKPVLISFYRQDELTTAKTVLHKTLYDTGISELPRLITRQGDSKVKVTVDDLLDLSVLVNERKLLSKLPRFVADNLPSVCQDNRTIATIARKMETLENRMAALGTMEPRLQQVEYLVAVDLCVFSLHIISHMTRLTWTATIHRSVKPLYTCSSWRFKWYL